MRLFVAVLFNDATKDKLINIQNQLKGQAYCGNYIRYENLHLNLQSIGEVPEDQIREVERILEKIKISPFQLDIGGLGRFRDKDGDVWWLRILRNKYLIDTYNQLYLLLAEMGFGMDYERFSPHITLVRHAEIKTDRMDLNFVKPSVISTEVSAISLMQADWLNNQPVYKEVYRKEFSF